MGICAVSVQVGACLCRLPRNHPSLRACRLRLSQKTRRGVREVFGEDLGRVTTTSLRTRLLRQSPLRGYSPCRVHVGGGHAPPAPTVLMRMFVCLRLVSAMLRMRADVKRSLFVFTCFDALGVGSVLVACQHQAHFFIMMDLFYCALMLAAFWLLASIKRIFLFNDMYLFALGDGSMLVCLPALSAVFL